MEVRHCGLYSENTEQLHSKHTLHVKDRSGVGKLLPEILKVLKTSPFFVWHLNFILKPFNKRKQICKHRARRPFSLADAAFKGFRAGSAGTHATVPKAFPWGRFCFFLAFGEVGSGGKRRKETRDRQEKRGEREKAKRRRWGAVLIAQEGSAATSLGRPRTHPLRAGEDAGPDQERRRHPHAPARPPRRPRQAAAGREAGGPEDPGAGPGSSPLPGWRPPSSLSTGLNPFFGRGGGDRGGGAPQVLRRAPAPAASAPRPLALSPSAAPPRLAPPRLPAPTSLPAAPPASLGFLRSRTPLPLGRASPPPLPPSPLGQQRGPPSALCSGRAARTPTVSRAGPPSVAGPRALAPDSAAAAAPAPSAAPPVCGPNSSPPAPRGPPGGGNRRAGSGERVAGSAGGRVRGAGFPGVRPGPEPAGRGESSAGTARSFSRAGRGGTEAAFPRGR
ncbi:PREDICTED: basic proline-rich protein-like [Chinchilla lanigera]|uniref:basic proline-rich protein-like n=1 Tax=Chinchilla lanigera TaxID=34839 RepID=UPI000695B561|nr:PREDICTED: basic proline-rich protein-like [Chinchilla lanigera]